MTIRARVLPVLVLATATVTSVAAADEVTSDSRVEGSIGLVAAYGIDTGQQGNMLGAGGGVRASIGALSSSGMPFAAISLMQFAGAEPHREYRAGWGVLELGYELPRFCDVGIRVFGGGGPADVKVAGAHYAGLAAYLGAAAAYHGKHMSLAVGVEYAFCAGDRKGEDVSDVMAGVVPFLEVAYRF